jgi:hypothetical protein
VLIERHRSSPRPRVGTAGSVERSSALGYSPGGYMCVGSSDGVSVDFGAPGDERTRVQTRVVRYKRLDVHPRI